jgi:hypothetical protein
VPLAEQFAQVVANDPSVAQLAHAPAIPGCTTRRWRPSVVLDRLAGYLSTWSAVQRARASTGSDPVPSVVESLRAAWGSRAAERRVEWPMTVHVGRV